MSRKNNKTKIKDRHIRDETKGGGGGKLFKILIKQKYQTAFCDDW